jgi:hypothetical protein
VAQPGTSAWRTQQPTDVGRLGRVTVAAALAGSAVVHATVVGEHLEEWAPAGLFFLTLVLLESALAVLALEAWSRSVAATVLVTSVATVAVWGVSRTSGMPIGPADFQVPEAVGRPDLVCAFLELVAAGVCARALARPKRARPGGGRPGRASLVWTAGVIAVAATLTVLGSAPALTGGGHDHGHSAGGRGIVSRSATPEPRG